MRRLFLVVLLMLTAAAVLFSILENGGGYVLIAVGDTTIEMTFIVAATINILSFVALYFLLGGLRMLFGTRRGVLAWAKNQRQQRGLNRTTQGLIAFIEGRWDSARKLLAKSAGNSSAPLINYLFAARASSAIGDTKSADAFLQQAGLSTQGADVAISLTQAELQIHNNQYEQALATLLRAKKAEANHPTVLNFLATVYRQLNDWDNLLKLLPAIQKFDVMPLSARKILEQEIFRAKLVRLEERKEEDDLSDCWKSFPGYIKKNPLSVAFYAEQLIIKKRYSEAEKVLRGQLIREYDRRLVGLYGLADSGSEKQLTFAEALLKSHPNDGVLLLAIARICLHQGLPKKAQQYLERGIVLEDVEGALAELAGIYAAQGDYKKGVENYTQELSLRAALNFSLGGPFDSSSGADLRHSRADKGGPLFTSIDGLKSKLSR